jgi:hypothetical protein
VRTGLCEVSCVVHPGRVCCLSVPEYRVDRFVNRGVGGQWCGRLTHHVAHATALHARPGLQISGCRLGSCLFGVVSS